MLKMQLEIEDRRCEPPPPSLGPGTKLLEVLTVFVFKHAQIIIVIIIINIISLFIVDKIVKYW